MLTYKHTVDQIADNTRVGEDIKDAKMPKKTPSRNASKSQEKSSPHKRSISRGKSGNISSNPNIFSTPVLNIAKPTGSLFAKPKKPPTPSEKPKVIPVAGSPQPRKKSPEKQSSKPITSTKNSSSQQKIDSAVKILSSRRSTREETSIKRPTSVTKASPKIDSARKASPSKSRDKTSSGSLFFKPLPELEPKKKSRPTSPAKKGVSASKPTISITPASASISNNTSSRPHTATVEADQVIQLIKPISNNASDSSPLESSSKTVVKQQLANSRHNISKVANPSLLQSSSNIASIPTPDKNSSLANKQNSNKVQAKVVATNKAHSNTLSSRLGMIKEVKAAVAKNNGLKG